MKKCAVIGYMPELDYAGANSFLQNVRGFKTYYPLTIMSERPEVNPDLLLKITPRLLKDATYPDKKPNKWAISNVLFLTAIRHALATEIDYFLYLEADCRVGCHEWDKMVFDEFIAAGEGKLMGGSIVAYNACNRNMAFMRCWRDFIVYNANSPWPMPAFGGGADAKLEPAVFPNGALGIYDTKFVASCYSNLENPLLEACNTTAWDYHLGRELVRRYGDESFTYLAHLSSIYSGYGNVTMTEPERADLIKEGKICAVHQIKSDWTTLPEDQAIWAQRTLTH